MLSNSIVSVMIGIVLGTLAGLGVGGGSLLMLWLTVVLGMNHPEARTVNLMFFLPCALIATCFRWRQGVIRMKELIPAIALGCICAASGTLLSSYIHTELLKKLFGGLLIITGIRELLYRPRKAK